MKDNNVSKLMLFLFGVLLIILLVSTIGRKILKHIMYSETPLPINQVIVKSDSSYTNIIFLHHSTGRNLINEGQVRSLLTKKGYSFWDHDYNFLGLVRPDGSKTKTCYDIPDDVSGTRGNGNTDPDGLAVLFNQPVHEPPDNAFSRLLQHEIIIFKSCFPNSAIKNEQMLNQYKDWFLAIRDTIDQHPDRIFILFTIPPLHPLKTNHEKAKRAREWANWLKSSDFGEDHRNLFVFDFFDLLADSSTNMLRSEFQKNPKQGDSHPNQEANKQIGPIFVEFIDNAINIYKKTINK